jgi:hypothetical protein
MPVRSNASSSVRCSALMDIAIGFNLIRFPPSTS